MEPPRRDPPAVPVTHDDRAERFEVSLDGGTAVLAYRRQPGTIVFVHTEVPQPLEGRGIAGRLAVAGLEFARAQGLAVVPVCPYMARYLAKHPEHLDLVAADDRARLLGLR